MTKLTVADVREKFPQYSDLSDDQLLEGVRRKFYADIPREKFFSNFGLTAEEAPAANRPPRRNPNLPIINPDDYEVSDEATPEGDIAAAMAAPNPDPRFRRFTQPGNYTDPVSEALGVAPPSDPFEGEGFGALAARRGQQFAQGATDVVAAVPESVAITGEMADRSRAAGAGGALDQRAQIIADIEATLQDPNLDPEDRALLERNLADLTEGQGVIQGMKDAPITPAQDRPIYGAGEKIRTAVSDVVGAPDPRDRSLWGQVATGAGNMTGMIGAAAAGTVVGGPIAGAAIGAGTGAAMNQSQVFEEALQGGADQETALQAAKWATLIGASEIIPITRALKLLPPRLRGELTTGMMRKFVDIAQASGEEAAQEYLATVANNIVAQQLYDADRGWTEGATEAALVGAVLGAGVGAAGVALEGRGNAAPPATVPPRPPAQPQTPEEELAAALGAPAPQAAPATPSAPAQPAQPRAEAEIAAAMGVEPATQEVPATPNLAPGSQAVVNDAANPAIGIDSPGPFNGATVTIDQDQADVPGGMRRVILPDGRKTVIGEALLVPPAAIRTAPMQPSAPAAPATVSSTPIAAAPASPASATPEADLAAAMGAPAPAPQQAQQPPQATPSKAVQPQAAPPAPNLALGNQIADPSRVPVGTRVAVSIGGQQPFTAEIIEQTRQGPRIREADGSVSVLPLDEIEDGAITFTEPAPEAVNAPEAEIAAAMGGDPAPQQADPTEGGRFEILDEIENTPGGPVATGRKVRVDLETGQATVVGADGTPAQAGGAPGAESGTGQQPQAEDAPVMGAGDVPPAAARTPDEELAAAMGAEDEAQPRTYGVGTFERPAEGDRPAATIEVTREGPFDFKTRFPAPDPRLLDALEREGRNTFEGDPTTEQVASILDDAMADAEQTYAATQAWQAEAEQLAKVTKPSSQIPTGKNNDKAIKLEIAQKAVQRGQRDFDDTVATIADVWGMDAAQQFRDEAIRRAGGIAGEPIQWPNEGKKPAAPTTAAPEDDIAAAMGAQPTPAAPVDGFDVGARASRFPTTLEDIATPPQKGERGRQTHIYGELDGKRYYLASVTGNANSAAQEWAKTYPQARILTTDRADGTSINGEVPELDAALAARGGAQAAPEAEIAAAMGAEPAPQAKPTADDFPDLNFTATGGQFGRKRTYPGFVIAKTDGGNFTATREADGTTVASSRDLNTLADLMRTYRNPFTGEAFAGNPFQGGTPATAPETPARKPDPMPEIDSIDFNPVRRDFARTPAGTEIEVEYAVIELDDLIASNLPDGRVNPNYPQERQPRDRTKDASERQIQRIMRDFDPRQLLESPTTDTGAMIVDRSGYVESGNGRTLALQRIFADRPDLARAYVEALRAGGYPLDGMDKPVLVRIRRTEMTPAEIEAYTRESSTDTKLAMSATEQAMSDAAALPDSALDLYRGGDIDTAGNRDFVRAFIQSVVTENEQGKMIAPDGSMSQDAVRRVQAALLAKAYGDPALVAKLIESADNNIKSIGGALLDVSASWAKMRAAARAGTIAPEMDQTDALIEAVRLVDRARSEKRNVIEFVKQPDLLSGDGISPMGQRFLALMFRDTRQWTKPAGRDRIASALRFYGDEAMKTTPGADMLGGTANPSATLDLVKERQDGEERRAERQQPNLFAPQPAGSDGESVRAAARDGDGPGTEGPVEGVGGERPAGQPEGVTRTANQAAPRPSERSTGTPDASADDMAPSSQRGETEDSDNADTEQSVVIPAPGEARARRRARATKQKMAEEASFATQEIVRLMPRLRAELDRLDLKKVKLFLDETDPDWQGMFQVTGDGDFEVIIGAALDPMKTLHHEVIHIMRQMNLFTPEEWRTLELAAGRGWMERHDIEARYPHLTHEERLEEAIAEEFSWALEKMRPPKGNILVHAFNKIHRLLKAIRNVFQGAGFNTPEDIFGRILSGEISKRQAWNTGYYARMGYNLQAALAPSAGEVEALAKRIKADLGLRDLSMFLSRGDLKVNMIAVDRAEQGRGKGSEAMRRIVAFADARGLRITLSPGQRDDGFGTTSRSRLVDFYKRFGFKENKGRAKDFAISEGMYRDPAPLVRLQAAMKSDDPSDTFAAQFMVELAQVDDLFLNPTSTATTLEGVFADIDPSVKMEGRLAADDPRKEGKDADRVTMFQTAKGKPFYIMETGREVWIDVSELGTGDGGNAIYSAIGDYAFNTGKVFIGDPDGLSATALRRRTDNMLSSALKHGTTRHLEPHQYQRDGDPRLGVPALRWTEGDDLGNLQSLIDVSVASLIQNIPEVADARYDFQTGTFRSGEGQPLTDGDLDKWASAARGSGKARIGRRSLKRGILLNTLARAESGQRPGLLERSLRQPRQLVTKGGISRTFYQARISGQPKPKLDPDQQEQQGAVQIEGNTAAERIAAANAAFGPPAGWVQPPLPMTWTLPIRTGLIARREEFQDKFVYLRTAQAQIEEFTGEKLPDEINAGLKETLFQPRVAERLDRLFKGEVQRVFDAMLEAKKRFGVTREDLWVYMVAKHAPERNAVMAKRDPERFANGNGSGLYDEAAAALLADLDAQGKTPHLEKLSAMLRKMLDDDLEHRRMNGLLSDEQFRSYKEMYRHYVPLRGFAERDDGDQIGRLGRGFDMRGKEVRTALGRTSIADDPISQIIVMRQEGIIRAEKNRVGRAMLKLAQKYPAPGLWEVIGKLPTRKYLDQKTGEVRNIVDFGAIDQNHTLAVKVGGEVQYLRIEDPLLLAAFNNLEGNLSWLEKLWKSAYLTAMASAKVVRLVSTTSTGLNPNFTIPNAQSDFIEGVWTAYNVDKKGMAAAYAKAYMPSFIEVIRDEFGDAFDAVRQRVMKSQKISDDEYREMKALVEEWKLSGGKTTFYAFRDLQEVSDDIARMIRKHGDKGWREASFGEKIETAKDLSGAPFRGLITVIDKINQPVESAGRLAMYVAARKMGLSKEQAAALSLDATTNYYRKGRATPGLRSFYAFINPSIQGIEKQARFSFKNAKDSRLGFALNWKNWVYVFGGVTTLSFVTTLINIAIWGAEDDDDPEGIPLLEKVSQFDRHRNLMIAYGIEYDEVEVISEDGTKVTKRVPRLKTANWRMAYPLRPFLALGSELALAVYGRRSAGDIVKNVGSAMLASWNPLADAQLANMPTPTPVDPVVDMALNRNFTGSPIVPEDTYGNNAGLPRSSQFFERSNSTAAVELTQFLNRATGGDRFHPGMIDIYPGHVDYLYKFITGGLGTFVQQSGGVIADTATGTETEMRNVPVLRSFATITTNFPEQEFYYDAREEATQQQNRLRAAFKAISENPNDEEAKALFDRLSVEMNASVKPNGDFDWTQSYMKPFQDADKELKALREKLNLVVNGDQGRKDQTEAAAKIRLQIEQVQRKARQQYIEMRTRNLALVPESD